MLVRHLDDPRDVLLSEFTALSDHELFVRRGLFVAEGRLVVRRLLEQQRLGIRAVLVTPTALAALRDQLEHRPALPVFVVPQAVMHDVTGFNLHRGCLALGERPAPRDWRPLAGDAIRLLVLERVGNADNVGSLFRNAAAFAVDAVLLAPSCADPLYRKAIRTSMGAALTVPFAQVDAWPGALDELRAAGWTAVALTPSAGARPLAEIAAAVRGRRTALVVGHEGEGLLPATLAACDAHARIPMAPGVDSLNAATAGAVALYELAR